MKKAILLTYNNDNYRSSLLNCGYNVIEYNLPLKQSQLNELTDNNTSDIIVIEVDDSFCDYKSIINDLNPLKTICLVREMTNEIKDNLILMGISDVIESNNSNKLETYIRALNGDYKIKPGRFIIYEDDLNVKNILFNIINTFGYELVFVEGIESLFKNLDYPHLNYILINIGIENLDIGNLIKRSNNQPKMKQNPVIAYRCLDDGLFIHEILSGLNKITDCILSYKELYSFLIKMLFNREFYSHIKDFTDLVNFDENKIYTEGNLNQLYFTQGSNLFHQSSVIDENFTEDVLSGINKVKQLSILSEGLKWLIDTSFEKKKITCAVDALF